VAGSKAKGLPSLVGSLVGKEPGTAEAVALQREIESLLMQVLRSGGRPAGDMLVDSLAGNGFVLKRLDALPSMWLVVLPAPRVLEIWFTGEREISGVAALSYRVGKPWGSKAQKAAAKLQAEFYGRFEKQPAKDARLSRDDRLIQLVGEFEADVNNGGFGQYLGNKGEARARKTLASLKSIGAKRTSEWLSAALEAGNDEATLQKLDQEFFANSEDLAVLTMKHIESIRK
jgi:hypothetical protein